MTTWTRKPKILICSDSAFLDTGFARVAREIGTALTTSGQYDVVQHGWFHRPTDRLVPFKVYSTERHSPEAKARDAYGQVSYDSVIERVKPDLVITIGDEWMVRHLAARPREHKMVGYLPIDGIPVVGKWVKTIASFDKVVAYGPFGKRAIEAAIPGLDAAAIAHGVNIETFRPIADESEVMACRSTLVGSPDRFIVGCVARNNVRKMLPRLLKGFRQFTRATLTCPACGFVMFLDDPANTKHTCGQCQAEHATLVPSPAKTNAMLYLHTKWDDHCGHDLITLVGRFGLDDMVRMPQGMQEGVGCPDDLLNRVYNGMDLFVLPTGGEGWGLPIAEAMACGVPVLVTCYSGHVDFCQGAAEFIEVSEMVTQAHNCAEHAIVDLLDLVFKMDRFYYEKDQFLTKWGPYLQHHGADMDLVRSKLSFGRGLRGELALAGRNRMTEYTWEKATGAWKTLINQVLEYDPVTLPEQTTETGRVEVL